MDGLRLAFLGAFPFPLPQGSQVYFADQARSLQRAGAACTLLTYGSGQGDPPADLRLVRSAAAPKRMRSGPHLAKPVADAGLLRAWRNLARRERFDAVLAHNAEAAAVALAARKSTGVPVIYVVHTLLGVELSAYLPGSLSGFADTIGRGLDVALARRVDAMIALSGAARDRLGGEVNGPVALIPPGLAVAPPPEHAAVHAFCKERGLSPDGFFLYSGNLDGYQELELLHSASKALPEDAPPIVVATHDARGRQHLGTGPRALRILELPDFDHMRLLCFGAQALLLARRRVGGFPIKLLNYMEAQRPIVAFDSVAEGLEHGESAWLMAGEAGSEAIAGALRTLMSDEELRHRLGAGARERLERAHDPEMLAARTLDWLTELLLRS